MSKNKNHDREGFVNPQQKNENIGKKEGQFASSKEGFGKKEGQFASSKEGFGKKEGQSKEGFTKKEGQFASSKEGLVGQQKKQDIAGKNVKNKDQQGKKRDLI